jgi:hypothetical protein
MIVLELVDILKTLPQDKDISLFWDGASRGDIEGIVNTSGEVVIVGDWSIYRDGDYRAYKEDEIVYDKGRDIKIA